MKKDELKNLLYERFQKRVDDIVKKRDKFQAEINEASKSLIQEYGPIAIAALRDIEISLPGAPKKQTESTATTAEKPVAETADPKKIARKRTPRKTGEETITQMLERTMPEVMKALGADDKEFTSRQVFEELVKQGLPDARITRSHVSLVLWRRKKSLGLKSVTRKIKVGNRSTKVNIFSLRKG